MDNIEKVMRARVLRRCRRPALASMEYGMICDELYKISSACTDIHYFVDGDRTLLDALDGDEEAEYEFQMAFSALDEKVNALMEALGQEGWAEPYDDDYDPEADFNSCLVALVGDFYRSCGDSIWGYDSGYGDYYNLCDWDAAYAVTEAGKRLCRKTKTQMLKSVQITLRIFLAMIDIREEFDYIKNAFDILKDENMALIKTIKDIEQAYVTAEEKSDGFRYRYCPEVGEFDRLITTLPDRCFLE